MWYLRACVHICTYQDTVDPKLKTGLFWQQGVICPSQYIYIYLFHNTYDLYFPRYRWSINHGSLHFIISLWFHRTSLPSRTWHSPGMFFLVAQGWWPEWWVYSRGFIPNKFYLHSYLRSFYVFFWIWVMMFLGIQWGYIYCLPSIQLFWSVSKWGWESNERGLRRVGGNRSALVVAERPGNMVVRFSFFPWFSTDLICWKRISPKKNCLEHKLQSRIWG